jgi:hypothetical protein
VQHRVVEHVPDGAPHFRGRPELTCEVVVPEHFAATCKSAIDRARNADRDAAHSAGEPVPVRSLDDEVQVIGLNGIVNDVHAE